MLLNLYKKKWNEGLKQLRVENKKKENGRNLKQILKLSKGYKDWIKNENEERCEKFAVKSVGKVDPKKHLLEEVEEL